MPLSLTTVCGLPRMPMSRVNSRATRTPDSDVSPARHLPHVASLVGFAHSRGIGGGPAAASPAAPAI